MIYMENEEIIVRVFTFLSKRIVHKLDGAINRHLVQDMDGVKFSRN